MVSRLIAALNRHNLFDLVSTRNHSRDFCAIRGNYFATRMRLMAIVFTVLASLWLTIDFVFLDPAQGYPMALLRAIVASLYAWLAMRTVKRHDLQAAHGYLGAFVFFASLFYIGARLIVPHADMTQAMLVGYYFLPFLLVTMLALFPMTVVESVWYLLVVGVLFWGLEWLVGDMRDIVTLGNAWLLAMMALMAVWAQLSQLHMLLRLYREATHDVLTGLNNRRALMNGLRHEVHSAQRSRRPLSVLLMDLDHFKRINDSHGHIHGDEVLRRFGHLLAELMQMPNIAGRFGGEEFFAVLPHTDKAGARAMAETIRQRCAELVIPGHQGEPIPVTVSIGVAQLETGEEVSQLISRVDDVLYLAKESGRNLVSTA